MTCNLLCKVGFLSYLICCSCISVFIKHSVCRICIISKIYSLVRVGRFDNDFRVIIIIGWFTDGFTRCDGIIIIRIVRILYTPVAEFKIRIINFRNLIRKNDDWLTADYIIIINFIIFIVFNNNMNRLEYGLVSAVAAFILIDNYKVSVCANIFGNINIKAVGMNRLIKINPVLLRNIFQFLRSVIRKIVSVNTRTSVILNEGDTVIINTLACIG